LLCLYDGGVVEAWDLKTGVCAKDMAIRLSRKGLTCLAADGERLWAADDSTLFRWSSKAGAWEKDVGFDAGGEGLAGLAPVNGVPLLVLPSKVIDPVKGRTFKVPKLEGYAAQQGPPLRILATHGTESMLWVGTGRGEWGGALLGLDPTAGTWRHWTDAVHYVTGITHAAQGQVIVSWSMSHFGANTLIRVHNPDATVKAEHPELAEKYYQCVTYSPYDNMLYGVESTDLVSIKDGKPSKIAKLDGRLYERERAAIGVAPGVLALVPVGRTTIVIVPKQGEPWRLREGELTRLRKP
jgi:hypothetical protein